MLTKVSMTMATTEDTPATATTASTTALNTRSMLNLCSLDPPKYGWTACGGIASILEPHEMARRREAKETFLIRQQEHLEEAKRRRNEEDETLLESRGSTQEVNNDSELAQKNNMPANKYCIISEPAAETSNQNNNASDDKEKSSDATNSNKNKNSSNSDSNSSAISEDKKKIQMKKITIQKMDTETGLIDIFTYHKGRVGHEARDPKTGELLCDSNPLDTNYNWVPPKMVVKVTVSFPLGDPDEEEYEDSDLSDEDEEDTQNENNNEDLKDTDSMARGSPTRASAGNSRRNVSAGGNSVLKNLDKHKKSEKKIPKFVQTVDWDLGDPSTPTAEEYAANIASEFGLNFPQMMDLKENIQKQLADFTQRQPHFFAPIKILDPYGNERPNVAFGPPERHCGSVCTSANKLSIKRSASGKATAGGGSSSSRSAAKPPRSRASVKPDKKGIIVVPKDQIEGPNKSGNKFAQEILDRCKKKSKALAAELIDKGQPALTIQKNDVCHICHNRKETVLCFPCGRHAYCDFHCGVSLFHLTSFLRIISRNYSNTSSIHLF